MAKSPRDLEQFYTRKPVAKRCVKIIKKQPWFGKITTFIEPSAGRGAFSSLLPNVIAIDIEPKARGIIKADFLTYYLKTVPKRTLVFGNPPFGRQSSLAFRFIKKACEIADYVAFILPRSFEKLSFQRRVPQTHRLALSVRLKGESFRNGDGEILAVPCVFQIWVRGFRPIPKTRKSKQVKFVKKHEDHDFAIRRVGWYAGRVKTKNTQRLSASTHYFIKVTSGDPDSILTKLRAYPWATITSKAVAARSLSKQEILDVIEPTPADRHTLWNFLAPR